MGTPGEIEGVIAPPDLDPKQSELFTTLMTSPYNAAWWTTTAISNIPPDAVGWLVAQGWQITSVTYDNTQNPPTPYYTMTRQSLQNWAILQSLLTEYTTAYNNALAANAFRYNDVIRNWTDLIFANQAHLDVQAEEQNDHFLLYSAALTANLDPVALLIDENQSTLVTDAAAAATALTAMDDKLSDLEDNANTNKTTIEDLLADQAGYLSTFLTDFAAELAELDTNYSAHLSEIQTLLSDADADLVTFGATQAAELADMELEYTSHAAELDVLLTTANDYLTTVANDIDAVLTAIATDYTDVDTEVNALLTSGTNAFNSHATDYNAVLALLEPDYDVHADTATNFLIDLGRTELARINEHFTASLTTQLQQLVDRGLYSGQVAIDVTARNARDKNEEIVALNDRLNQEKWENQHRLYGQQVEMRDRTLNGKDRVHTLRQEILRYQAAQITGLYQLLQAMRDRTQNGKQTIYALREANIRFNIELKSRLYDLVQALRRLLVEEAARLHQLQQAVTQWEASQRDRLLEQVQQIETQQAAGIDRQHAAQQDISRVAMSERDALLAQLQDAVKGIISGKERYSAMTMQNASTLAEHRHRAILEKMNVAAVRLNGLQVKHEETMKLMMYQLDERNQLFIGLYAFVERREDSYPSFESLTQLCTGLGDSAGGWVTP
jgi:hypothetical protein